MKKENNKKIYVIDTSAILTGKQLDLSNSEICTTVNIEKEFTRKGKDQNNYNFLKQKGLKLFLPKKESILKIKNKAKETNDY
jgi:rRNA maturation endonuclease Nob1